MDITHGISHQQMCIRDRLYTFTAQQGIGNPEKSDELFPMIATGNYFPGIVGILFIIGLIALSLIHI